jgi:NAD(P)-dependent dehydrogenase (short-subunit alcohol dehydrogenase family)
MQRRVEEKSVTFANASRPAGRVWLITGGSSGFGLAIARAALEAGDTVIAGARRLGPLNELVAQGAGRFRAVTLDVTDAWHIEEVVANAVADFGRIDVLVNNAGHGHVGAVEETGDDELREIMNVHFFGPAELVRAVLGHMRGRGSGAIVQMSSFGGQLSVAGFGAYSASKCALEGLSEALAEEVRPYGIKVLIVEPGAFRTGFSGGALHESPPLDAYRKTVGATRSYVKSIDGRQPGDPAKAAAAILAALDADPTPLRLPLGDDAVDALLGHLERVRSELLEWESVSRDVGFEDAVVAM